MKLSTIATSTFLLVASAAADNNSKTAGNLKKRLLEDTMSMPATEEASDPDKQHWWYKPDPTPGCNGIPTTTCEGFEYLKLVTGASLGNADQRIPWTFFYEHTPEGCVLAPIDTAEDLLKAQAAVAPRADINAWVGLFKEAADVCGGADALLADCPVGSAANENNWKNLDGTLSTIANPPYPDNDRNNVWTGGEPNNSSTPPGVQQYVHIRSDTDFLLRDLNDQNNEGPKVAAAVYKCCNSAPLLTFADCSK